MAQKTNPLAFRSLNNFENSFCHQQVYKKNLSPYVLKEHKKIKEKQSERAKNKPKRAKHMPTCTFQTAYMKHGPTPP